MSPWVVEGSWNWWETPKAGVSSPLRNIAMFLRKTCLIVACPTDTLNNQPGWDSAVVFVQEPLAT